MQYESGLGYGTHNPISNKTPEPQHSDHWSMPELIPPPAKGAEKSIAENGGNLGNL